MNMLDFLKLSEFEDEEAIDFSDYSREDSQFEYSSFSNLQNNDSCMQERKKDTNKINSNSKKPIKTSSDITKEKRVNTSIKNVKTKAGTFENDIENKNFENRYFAYYNDVKQPKKYILEDW